METPPSSGGPEQEYQPPEPSEEDWMNLARLLGMDTARVREPAFQQELLAGLSEYLASTRPKEVREALTRRFNISVPKISQRGISTGPKERKE